MRGRLVARLREVSSNICSTRAIGSVTRLSFKLVSHLCVCFPQTIVCGSALYKYASEDFLSFPSPVCLTGFLKTLPPNGLFLSNSFFFLQNSHDRKQECNHCFFLFSSFLPPRSFFLFLLSFSFVSVSSELIGPKKSAF